MEGGIEIAQIGDHAPKHCLELRFGELSGRDGPRPPRTRDTAAAAVAANFAQELIRYVRSVGLIGEMSAHADDSTRPSKRTLAS